MRSTVLEPLGMTASRFDQPPGEEVVRLAATAHDARGRVVEGRWRVHPEQAAAGLWTNPSELARYVVEIQLAHEGKSAKVLTRETVDAMLTRQGDGAAGLGPFIHESGGVKRFSHGGQNLGFSCLFVGLLDRGQGAVVMTNSDIGGRLVAEIMNAVAVEYGWPDYLPPERDVVVLDAERLDRYVGRYVFSAASSATIKREGDRLVASVSDGPDLELYFENETTFFTDQARVGGTFVVDGDGRASEIRLDIAGEKHSAKWADD
jgi:CubicO group peptidase (beta-lactamase class C family)